MRVHRTVLATLATLALAVGLLGLAGFAVAPAAGQTTDDSKDNDDEDGDGDAAADGRTRLLFPYVSSQAGFDTGMAISNTTDAVRPLAFSSSG